MSDKPKNPLDIRNRNMDRNKGFQKEDFWDAMARAKASKKEKDSKK